MPILPKGLLAREPLQGRDEDTVASADFSSTLSEEEKEELKAELVQVCVAIFLLLFLALDLESYWYSISPILQLCCLSFNEI